MSDQEKVIFVGHGASELWRALEPWAKKRGFRCLDFNSSSPVGYVAIQRVIALLGRANYALMVLTGEDVHSDGSIHTRENVIHEIGLCHGKLGLGRTALLLEEGCSIFSNIAGVQTIRFSKGDLESASAPIRRLLSRWANDHEGSDVEQLTATGRDSCVDVESANYGPSSTPLPAELQSTIARRLWVALREPWIVYFALGVAPILVLSRGKLVPYVRYLAPLATKALIVLACIACGGILYNYIRSAQIARQLARIRNYYDGNGRNFRDRSFRGIDFKEIDLSGADFSRSDLERVNLSRATLHHTVWRDASIISAQLDEAIAATTNFNVASFDGVSLVRIDLSHSNLSGASLVDCVLDDANLSHARLRDAYLRQTSLASANLEHGDLRDAKLRNVDLRGANLSHADLSDADLRVTSLRDADLSYADVRRADFFRCDLRGARLDGVRWNGVDLQDCLMDGRIAEHSYAASGSVQS